MLTTGIAPIRFSIKLCSNINDTHNTNVFNNNMNNKNIKYHVNLDCLMSMRRAI